MYILLFFLKKKKHGCRALLPFFLALPGAERVVYRWVCKSFFQCPYCKRKRLAVTHCLRRSSLRPRHPSLFERRRNSSSYCKVIIHIVLNAEERDRRQKRNFSLLSLCLIIPRRTHCFPNISSQSTMQCTCPRPRALHASIDCPALSFPR